MASVWKKKKIIINKQKHIPFLALFCVCTIGEAFPGKSMQVCNTYRFNLCIFRQEALTYNRKGLISVLREVMFMWHAIVDVRLWWCFQEPSSNTRLSVNFHFINILKLLRWVTTTTGEIVFQQRRDAIAVMNDDFPPGSGSHTTSPTDRSSNRRIMRLDVVVMHDFLICFFICRLAL